MITDVTVQTAMWYEFTYDVIHYFLHKIDLSQHDISHITNHVITPAIHGRHYIT